MGNLSSAFLKTGILFVFGFGLILNACEKSSTTTFLPCEEDRDCPEGRVCQAGECILIQDGDTDSLGESDQDQSCPDDPTYPPALPPETCKKWQAFRMDPPDCWGWRMVADSTQNGEACFDNENSPGQCVDGTCIANSGDGDQADGDQVDGDSTDGDSTDGDQTDGDLTDGDLADGDAPMNICQQEGGSCNDYTANCPSDSRLLSGDGLCDLGVCCIPLSAIDCYNSGGYCSPTGDPQNSYFTCREGYHAAQSAMECDLFGGDAGEWCCEKDTSPCVAEGGVTNILDDWPDNDQCCEGLDEVSNAVPDEQNQCIALPDGTHYCTYCGDGICGPGENYCRCYEDCATPGQCQENSDCPLDTCYDLPVASVFPVCSQQSYSCDQTSGNCTMAEEIISESICDASSGLCKPWGPTVCESEGNGECIMYGRATCAEGSALNEDPLGCDAMCCLDAACLDEGGYCTMWQTGCKEGFVEGGGVDKDCPGGRSALCCVPEQNTCTPLGGVAIMPDGFCCNGLKAAEMAEVGSNGECLYPDCSCFVCISEGDGFCDEENHENECNSADCEGPIPECLQDSDCPVTACNPSISADYCLLRYHQCEDTECVAYDVGVQEARCDPYSLHCVTNDYSDCEMAGGYCSHYLAGCDDGYEASSDAEQLGCPGGRSALCCRPEPTNECEEEGGFCIGWGPECPQDSTFTDADHQCTYGQCCMPLALGDCANSNGYCESSDVHCINGYTSSQLGGCPYTTPTCCILDSSDCASEGHVVSWGTDEHCCDGLTEAEVASVDSTGQCAYADIAASICLRIGDDICDEDFGENPCNSADCQQYECLSIGGQCVDYWGCPTGYSPAASPQCDQYGHCCLPEDMITCYSNYGGYCSTPQIGCQAGYASAGESMGCEYIRGDSGICCIATPDRCTSDEDCGGGSCEDTDDGCLETLSHCDSGDCVYAGVEIPGGHCDSTGQCVAGQADCVEDLGGFCASWMTGCPADSQSVDAACGDQVCAGGCICCVSGQP